MADHFYAKARKDVDSRDDSTITVGTSTAGVSTIEVRVPDGLTTLRRQEVYDALRHIADFIVTDPSIAILR